MRWSGFSMSMGERKEHKPIARNIAAVSVRCLIALAVCGSLCFDMNGQPFIRGFEVLQDSVPVAMEHGHQGSPLAPLNVHCLCLRIPGGIDGKVLVELLEVSPKGFANFFGYASNGRLWSCFKSDAIAFKQGSLLFEERPSRLMTIRRPADTRFR